MMLTWVKPQEVGNVGLVYISKCRRFMIIRNADKNYSLSYRGTQYTKVGDFPELQKAKAKATEINDTWSA